MLHSFDSFMTHKRFINDHAYLCNQADIDLQMFEVTFDCTSGSDHCDQSGLNCYLTVLGDVNILQAMDGLHLDRCYNKNTFSYNNMAIK